MSSASSSISVKSDKSSSKKSGSTLQKIAQKKEQLRLYPRIKKIERIATHLPCEVHVPMFIDYLPLELGQSVYMGVCCSYSLVPSLIDFP